MIYLALYGLVTISLTIGVIYSVSDVKRLTAAMNGKFAKSVQPEAQEEK